MVAFNDKDFPAQVTVTSVRISFSISFTAISFQKDCSDVIFMDVPSKAQSTLQAGGRVIRIGQRSACNLYILTTDYSYDQALQATAANKIDHPYCGLYE